MKKVVWLLFLCCLMVFAVQAGAETKTIPQGNFLQEIRQVVLEEDIPEGYTPVYTKEDLQKIVSKPGGKYILMNDISLADSTELHKVKFKGVLEGNGHTLQDLNYVLEGPVKGNHSIGLFSTVNGGEVRNLQVKGSIKIGSGKGRNHTSVGGLAGKIEGKSQIVNCVMDVDIYCEETEQSSMMLVISDSSGEFGGVTGLLDASKGAAISYCRNKGEIKALQYVGGIAGIVQAGKSSKAEPEIIFACLNEGTVFGSLEAAGGIVGEAINKKGSGNTSFVIGSCANLGNVTGCWNVGGILGNAEKKKGWVTVSDCLNAGEVIGTDAPVVYVGGIVGNGDCYVFGCVNASEYIGNVASGIHTNISEEHLFSSYHLNNVEGAMYHGFDEIIAGNPLSKEQMRSKESFPELNFDEIWLLEDGMAYPFPREVYTGSNRIDYSGWEYQPGEYFTDDKKPCKVHYTDIKCKNTFQDGEIRVALGASQCFGFARYAQYEMYGVNSYQDAGSFAKTDGLTPSQMTEENLRKLLEEAGPGAHLRTGAKGKDEWGHSMIVVEITDTGFEIIQCNGRNNDQYDAGYEECRIGTYTYTWASYISDSYGGRGIEYIEYYKK